MRELIALPKTISPVLEAVPWPAVLLDPTGCIAYANKEMEARGVAAKVGQPLKEVLPEYASALRGSPPWDAQERLVARDAGGRQIHERLWLRPTADGAVLIVVDESRLQQLETEHVQTVRLASLGFLLAGVCHEVSNPLAAIHSMLQLLKNQAPQDPQMLRKGLESISLNVQRILEISRKLSSFSRTGTEQKRPTSVDEAIEEALCLVRHEHWFRNVLVEHHKDPGAAVWCNPSEMQQVFFNVLANAAQAMEGTGRILITTRRVDGKRVEVMVQDDGPGIRPEHLPKLFEPFFSTKPAGHGTGLGLTICNELLQEHGGTIRAESTLGKGARFYIDLPLWSRS